MLIRSFAVIAAKLVFAAFAIFAFSAAAEAQFLTFVSSTGVDARPCTVEAQPCKTLQRAVAVTSAGGTIRILSDLVGQPFPTIAKSLTVEGGGHSMLGTIVINSASAVVTLRGLNLTGVGAVANGIRIYSAAAVHIEDCTVERYTNDGIQLVATTATKLFISDTVARTSSDGLYADAANAQVVIKNSAFDQNSSSGAYIKVAKASVTGSSASGNFFHGFILEGQRVKITETTADNNSGNGYLVRGAGRTVLSSAEASGNGAAGLHIDASGLAYASDCTFSGSSGAGGVGVNNQGILFTRGNNTVAGGSTGISPVTSAAF